VNDFANVLFILAPSSPRILNDALACAFETRAARMKNLTGWQFLEDEVIEITREIDTQRQRA